MTPPVQNHRDIVVDHPVKIVSGGESFYPDLSPDRPDYLTTDGVLVWMERKRQKVRFVDADGNQHGPTQANLVPAVIYARQQGWTEPGAPDWWNEGRIPELPPVEQSEIPTLEDLPRPVLDPERRDSLVEIDTIAKPKYPAPCMAVVGHAEVDPMEQITERVWSGGDRSEVLCGKLATIYAGCNYCTEHGAIAEAERIQNEVFRETGTWLPSESRPMVPRQLVILRQRRVGALA